MPVREIPEPLAAAAEILEKAAYLGASHFADVRDVSLMGKDDEERYIVHRMAVSLADEWLKTKTIDRHITRDNADRADVFEYRVKVVMLTAEEWNTLKAAIAAAVRREHFQRQDRLSNGILK